MVVVSPSHYSQARFLPALAEQNIAKLGLKKGTRMGGLHETFWNSRARRKDWLPIRVRIVIVDLVSSGCGPSIISARQRNQGTPFIAVLMWVHYVRSMPTTAVF